MSRYTYERLITRDNESTRVRVAIDLDELARYLALHAKRSKNHRTVMASGAVEGQVVQPKGPEVK